MSTQPPAQSPISGSWDNEARGRICALTLPSGWGKLTEDQINTLFPGMAQDDPCDMMCVSFAEGDGTDKNTDHEGNNTFVPARCVVNAVETSRDDAQQWKQTVVQRIEETFPFAYLVDVVEGNTPQGHPFVLALSHFIVNDTSLTGMHYSWHQTTMIENDLKRVGIHMVFQCPSSLFRHYEQPFSHMMASCRVLSGKER